MQSPLMSAEDCAREKGVTPQAITAAIRRNELPATKIGRDWVIRREDCDNYRPATSYAERGKRGGASQKV